MISDGSQDKNAGRGIDKKFVVITPVVVDGQPLVSSSSAPLSAKTLSYSFTVSSPSTSTETSHVVYITAFPPSTASSQPVLPKLDRQASSDGAILAYAIPVSLGGGVVLGIVITALVRVWWRNHRHNHECNRRC